MPAISGNYERMAKRYWSGDVTSHSNALDLEGGVFSKRGARTIAESLKRSAERSRRRKVTPFRSAMSMLIFYINRAGKNLSPSRRKTLERAKDELRKLFGKLPRPSRTHARGSSRRKRTSVATTSAKRRKLHR
jgi:hypothetical protein